MGFILGGEQLDLPPDGHARRCGYTHVKKSSVELHPLSVRDTVSLTHTHQRSYWILLYFALVPVRPLMLHPLRICSYDDYDYGSVNVLLERSLKVFVKTMACHPEQTTARIYGAFWRHFRHSEKVLPSFSWVACCISAEPLYVAH